MTEKLPRISLDDIRSRATPQSFSRGEGYYHSGAIFDLARHGNTIGGRCEGSDYSPYNVLVVLGDTGSIDHAICTCPYDWGGDCKHIVALLLTYHHDPELFEETPASGNVIVVSSLEARSKEDLIMLIREMLILHPDLESLINRPVSDSSTDIQG